MPSRSLLTIASLLGLYYGGQPAQPLLTFAERPFDLYACSNIAIGFQHSVVTKHLHAALDDDLATILADVAQLAQPGLPALELRAQLSMRPTASLSAKP